MKVNKDLEFLYRNFTNKEDFKENEVFLDDLPPLIFEQNKLLKDWELNQVKIIVTPYLYLKKKKIWLFGRSKITAVERNYITVSLQGLDGRWHRYQTSTLRKIKVDEEKDLLLHTAATAIANYLDRLKDLRKNTISQ